MLDCSKLQMRAQCIWDPEVSAHDISGQCKLELQEGLKPVVLERQKAVGGLWTVEGKVSWPLRTPPWPLFASNHAVSYLNALKCVCVYYDIHAMYYISVCKYIYIGIQQNIISTICIV